MQHPIEPGPQQHYDVCAEEGGRPGRRDGARIAVGHHALAHGRRQERQVGVGDQTADGGLGARVGGALADDHQRAVGGEEQGGGTLKVVLKNEDRI